VTDVPEVSQAWDVHPDPVVVDHNGLGGILRQGARQAHSTHSRIGVERIDHKLLDGLERRCVELLGQQRDKFS